MMPAIDALRLSDVIKVTSTAVSDVNIINSQAQNITREIEVKRINNVGGIDGSVEELPRSQFQKVTLLLQWLGVAPEQMEEARNELFMLFTSVSGEVHRLKRKYSDRRDEDNRFLVSVKDFVDFRKIVLGKSESIVDKYGRPNNKQRVEKVDNVLSYLSRNSRYAIFHWIKLIMNERSVFPMDESMRIKLSWNLLQEKNKMRSGRQTLQEAADNFYDYFLGCGRQYKEDSSIAFGRIREAEAVKLLMDQFKAMIKKDKYPELYEIFELAHKKAIGRYNATRIGFLLAFEIRIVPEQKKEEALQAPAAREMQKTGSAHFASSARGIAQPRFEARKKQNPVADALFTAMSIASYDVKKAVKYLDPVLRKEFDKSTFSFAAMASSLLTASLEQGEGRTMSELVEQVKRDAARANMNQKQAVDFLSEMAEEAKDLGAGQKGMRKMLWWIGFKAAQVQEGQEIALDTKWLAAREAGEAVHARYDRGRSQTGSREQQLMDTLDRSARMAFAFPGNGLRPQNVSGATKFIDARLLLPMPRANLQGQLAMR